MLEVGGLDVVYVYVIGKSLMFWIEKFWLYYCIEFLKLKGRGMGIVDEDIYCRYIFRNKDLVVKS